MIYMLLDLASILIFSIPAACLLIKYFKVFHLKKMVLLLIFTVYLSQMFDIVGIPAIQYIRWDPNLNLIPFADIGNSRFVFQVVANALMFLPLGFLLPLIWDSFRTWKRTLLAGFLASLQIEFVQMFCSRATDVDDLIMNTLGCAVGYGLAWLLFHKKWPSAADNARADQKEFICFYAIPLLVIVFLRTPLSIVIYRFL